MGKPAPRVKKPTVGDREIWPTAKVRPHPENARTHSKAQIQQLRALLRQFGFTYPILVDEKGLILAGHGRLEAAKANEMPTVPVMVCRGWSEAKKRAYRLADNRVALNSGWDDDALRRELAALARETDFELTSLGFTENELERLEIPGFEAGPAGTNELGAMKYAVIIRCDDEAQSTALLERFTEEGLECETLIS